MPPLVKPIVIGLVLVGFPLAMLLATPRVQAEDNPVVVINTSMGAIKAELYPDRAPETVKNFLRYVDEGFYSGTIFHRVISNFVIQGGGYDVNMTLKKTHPPIKNEAANGLKNERGTLAMARTSVPDSATSQFYINVRDNRSLDYRDSSVRGIGYCVFGKVIEGMDVVDKIRKTPTTTMKGMANVPVTPVVIQSITRAK